MIVSLFMVISSSDQFEMKINCCFILKTPGAILRGVFSMIDEGLMKIFSEFKSLMKFLSILMKIFCCENGLIVILFLHLTSEYFSLICFFNSILSSVLCLMTSKFKLNNFTKQFPFKQDREKLFLNKLFHPINKSSFLVILSTTMNLSLMLLI